MSSQVRVTSVDHTDRSRGVRTDRPAHAVAGGRHFDSSPPRGVALHHHVPTPTAPPVAFATPLRTAIATPTHVVAGSGHMPSVVHSTYRAPSPVRRPPVAIATPTHVVAGSGHMPSVVHVPSVTHHVPVSAPPVHVVVDTTPTYVPPLYGVTPSSVVVRHDLPRRHTHSTVHVIDRHTWALIGAIALIIIGLALTIFGFGIGEAAGIPIAIVGLAIMGGGVYLTWKNCNARRVDEA